MIDIFKHHRRETVDRLRERIAGAGARWFRLNVLGSGPSAPPPPEFSWDGAPENQTLTVLVEHFAGVEDVRYAPFPYTANIRVTGSVYGDTPTDRTLPDPAHNRISVVTVTEDTTLGRNTLLGDPSHRERSFRPGWQPMHVFTQPGTYTVVQYAYDEAGKWGKSAPFTLVVTSPLEKVAVGDRIILSNVPGETWDEAPEHDPANRVTTLTAAMSRLSSFSNVNRPHGVWIKRGTTYSESGPAFDGSNGSPWGNPLRRAIVTTWGTGARPVLDPAPSLSYGTRSPVNFDGLRCVYNWDRQIEGFKPGREEWVASPNTNVNATVAGNDVHHALFNDCDISDTAPASQVYYRNNNESGSPEFALFFNDCLLRDLGDYISLDCRRVGFLNSAVRVTPGAATGHMDRRQMGGRTDFGQSHNSMRQAAEGHYIDGSFMEGRGGWSGSNGSGMTHDHQALLRAQGTANWPGQRNQLSRSTFIGDLQIGKTPKSIVESCVIVFDPALRNNLGLQIGAMDAVRNCHFLFVGNAEGMLPANRTSNFDTDGSGLQVAPFQGFVRIEEKNIALPFQLVHNSFTVHRNAANLPTALNTLRSGPTLTVTTVQSGHNVTYAPDHSQVPSGGVTLLTQPWTILDVWVRVGWERSTYILPTNLGPNGLSDLIPYPQGLDLTQLTQADFAGTRGRGAVRVPFRSGGEEKVYLDNTGDLMWGSIPNGCDILYESDGFRVRNTSSDTWLAGATMRILHDRGTTLMAPWYYWTVPQEKVRLFRPVNPQPLTPGAPSALFDFSMRRDRLRPNAGFAISPTTGENSAGALLPA